MFDEWLQGTVNSGEERNSYRVGMERFMAFVHGEKEQNIGDPEKGEYQTIDEYIESYLSNNPDFVSDYKDFVKELANEMDPRAMNQFAMAVKRFFREKKGIKIPYKEQLVGF